jgi:ABC-type amino acid transport substrate-binding protein
VNSFGKDFQNTKSSVKSIIFSDQFKLSLSEKERGWLKQHPVVKLGIDRAFPPFGSINEKDEYIGFSADMMRMIEHRLGFKFDVKTDIPWNETMEMAKTGEIDMISALVDSKQRQSFLNFSDTYIENPTIIISDAEENGYIGSLKNLNGIMKAIKYPF